MANNWINDAKGKIETERENERIQEEKRRQHEEENVNLIHSRTLKDRIEIEKVLIEAQNQGLIVSNPVEGLVSQIVNNDCHLVGMGTAQFSPFYWKFQNKWVEGISAPYAISWTVTEPTTGEKMMIFLGLRACLCLAEESSISGPEVEAQIKAWLVKIFSEQK